MRGRKHFYNRRTATDITFLQQNDSTQPPI